MTSCSPRAWSPHAGEQGLNLLTGNIVTGETSDEFSTAQLALIDEYRRARARYRDDPVLAQVAELRLELPYEFDWADYEQILHDARHLIAPELGWRPGNSTMSSEILNKAIPLYPHALTGEGSSGIRTRNGVHGAHQGPFAPGGCS